MWSKIKCNDGSFKTDINSILKEQMLFYEKLFKSEGYDENEAESLLSSVNISLSRNEKENCDRPVTESEIENATKLLKSNKSPGDDGIINEFYKLYWYMIKPEFTKVLQYIFTSFNMSSSQYRAIISLLYQKRRKGRCCKLASHIAS